MGAVVALLAVAMLALVLPGQATAGSAQGCELRGSVIVERDARARILYRRSNDTYYGCLERQGRVRQLSETSSPDAELEDIALAPPYAAIAWYDPHLSTHFNVYGACVFDLRTGRRAAAGCLNLGEFDTFVLTRSGSVAWGETERRGQFPNPGFIQLSDRNGRRQITAPGYDARSLALSQNERHVYWTQNGEVRTTGIEPGNEAATAVSAQPAADAATTSRCDRGATGTLDRDRRGRLFRRRFPGQVTVYYGCLERTGRRVRLADTLGNSEIPEAAVLASPHAVLVWSVEEGAYTNYTMCVFDLRARRPSRRACFAIASFAELALTRRGSVAWVEPFVSGGQLGDYAGAIRVRDRDGHRAVGGFEGYERGSLALSRDQRRVYWRRNGEARSTQIR